MSLGAIWEDVQFDHDGANRLARQLRSTATLIESHADRRPGLADSAREEWRGSYAEEFDGRLATCQRDGRRLVRALRLAANGLVELSEAAQREQKRREDAREWQRQQEDRNFWERSWDNVTGFFGGRNDLPPPPPPEDPPRYITVQEVAAAR